MSDYNSLIANLNRKLFFKFNKIEVKPLEGDKERTVESYIKNAFNQHYGGNRDIGTTDTGNIDVPDVSAVDDEYTTSRAHDIKPDHPIKRRPQRNSEKEEKDDIGDDTPISVDLGEKSDLKRYDKENMDQREKARQEFVKRQKEARAKRNVQEQGEELPASEAVPKDPTAEPGPEDMGEPEMQDPGMGDVGGDPGMGDPGMGDPALGMPGEEEPTDPNELGRTYEMKKIYSRLISMNQYLADEMSPKIFKTKQAIAKSIDLFSIIGANPESYKNRIDEIIVGYYRFLETAYKTVKSYYKAEAQRVGGLPLEKNEEQKDDKETEVTI